MIQVNKEQQNGNICINLHRHTQIHTPNTWHMLLDVLMLLLVCSELSPSSPRCEHVCAFRFNYRFGKRLASLSELRNLKIKSVFYRNSSKNVYITMNFAVTTGWHIVQIIRTFNRRNLIGFIFKMMTRSHHHLLSKIELEIYKKSTMYSSR